MTKKPKKYTYSRSEARENLPQILNRICDGGRAVYITNRGKEEAVLVAISDYTPKKKVNFDDLNWAGMWEGRKDMKDSVAWVRKIREEEEKDI